MSRNKITLVIPVYNEAQAFTSNIDVIYKHLDSLRDIDIDVIIVDDGSEDQTENIVRQYCAKQENVSLLSFTRNFGKEAAIQAGLDHAKGDAVIVMDSDLQHPPELIPKMIALWQQGAYIVEAYKVSRGRESFWYRVLAKYFYAIFNRLSGLELKNQTDYKLLDRRVVESIRNLPEGIRFFRGIVQWLGFPAQRIPFEVPERVRGDSSWSRIRLASYSVSAITSFSAAPLQFVTLLGAITLVISLIFGGIAVYDKLMGHALSGFTTVILLILIIGSILMFSFGLVGVYIARIYDELKGRPRYVIQPSDKTREGASK